MEMLYQLSYPSICRTSRWYARRINRPAFVGRVLHKGNLRFPVSSSLGLSPLGDGLAEPLLRGMRS